MPTIVEQIARHLAQNASDAPGSKAAAAIILHELTALLQPSVASTELVTTVDECWRAGIVDIMVTELTVCPVALLPELAILSSICASKSTAPQVARLRVPVLLQRALLRLVVEDAWSPQLPARVGRFVDCILDVLAAHPSLAVSCLADASMYVLLAARGADLPPVSAARQRLPAFIREILVDCPGALHNLDVTTTVDLVESLVGWAQPLLACSSEVITCLCLLLQSRHGHAVAVAHRRRLTALATMSLPPPCAAGVAALCAALGQHQDCERRRGGDVRVKAATQLQAVWRATLTRRTLAAHARAAVVLQRCFRRWRARRHHQATCAARQLASRAQATETHRQQRIARNLELAAVIEDTPAWDLRAACLRADENAAVCVQRMWRGFLARKERRWLMNAAARQKAAIIIQSSFRGHLFARRQALSVDQREKLQFQIDGYTLQADVLQEGEMARLQTTAAALVARHCSTAAKVVNINLEQRLARLLTVIPQQRQALRSISTELHGIAVELAPIELALSSVLRANQLHLSMLHASVTPPAWWERLATKDENKI